MSNKILTNVDICRKGNRPEFKCFPKDSSIFDQSYSEFADGLLLREQFGGKSFNNDTDEKYVLLILT